MVPRMLIATRFGLGIKDPSWFEHRLVLLAAITASSLMAQEDQEFEWVLFVDPGLPGSIREKLEQILAPFEDRAHVWPGSREPAALHELVSARDLIDDQGAVLVGRIDDDDAWVRGTVGEVRARVNRWCATATEYPGYGLSFESGLVWRMYDMVDLDQQDEEIVLKAAVRSYTCPFTSISGYTYAGVEDALNAVVTGHASVERLMMERGYTVDIVASDRPMWLYCRHKQTDGPIRRGEGPELGLTVGGLQEQFGIDAPRVRAYIANSDIYGYVRSLRMQGLRANAVRELREIDRTLAMMADDERKDHSLVGRRITLIEELGRLSMNAIRNPEA